MVAIMYDGLELGTFFRDDDNILKLSLHNNTKKSWLPYIFEIGVDKDSDMEVVIKAWIRERVFPKNRYGSKKILKELGLQKYDMDKIAEITRCSLITDPYWIAYEDTDRYSTHSVRGQFGLESYPYNSLDIKDEENYTWRI